MLPLPLVVAALLSTQTPAAEPNSTTCEPAPTGMACIPEGNFIRGLDRDTHKRCWQMGRAPMSYPDTEPAQTIWLDTFYMDATEVTVEAYQDCVQTGRCTPAGPRYSDFSDPKQPITGMTWFQAVAYCEAQGKHLPTEAEWEKAARGPHGARTPFGNAPVTCEQAVIRDDRGRSCGVKKRGKGSSKGKPARVASKPAGHYGLHDMVGNVEEWVFDWHSTSWRDCGEACQGRNPRGPCEGRSPCRGHRYRSVRGGSWYWTTIHATATHRRPHTPVNRMFHHFGFRCAASAEEAHALVAAATD